MAICFINNIYLCFLPAHTSHGLQSLDNGIFNLVKAAYRSELNKLASLTDAAPVDKINFIRCYTAARCCITRRAVVSAFRTTGQWPVNRQKALNHPEIQAERENTPEAEAEAETERSAPSPLVTPKTSRQVMDLANEGSPGARYKFRKIAKAFGDQEIELVLAKRKIAELEARLKKLVPKRRKKIPNPNKKFMDLVDILAADQIPAKKVQRAKKVVVVEETEDDEGGWSTNDGSDLSEVEGPTQTRSGCAIKLPTRYLE